MIRRAFRTLVRILARLVAWVLGTFVLPPLESPTPKSILVIRIDERVGNVLLTTPLLRALKAAPFRPHVDVLVAASKAAIVEGLTRVIPFQKRDVFVAPWRFVRTLMRLRHARYDVAIDASHWHDFSLTSAFLLLWTGARMRIAHDRGDARWFASHVVRPPSDATHETDIKASLLFPLEIRENPPPMWTALGTSTEVQDTVASWLVRENPGRAPCIALLVGSRKPDHRIQADVFVDVGRTLVARGLFPLILWGPNEKHLARDVASRGGGTLAPPTDLDALSGFLRACRVAVTNDSGPMHLAAAVGVPTIALLLNENGLRWAPRPPPHRAIFAHDLAPNDLAATILASVDAALATRD